MADGEHATDRARGECRLRSEADSTPATQVRGLDPAQQQFDLDEVPRAVPAAAPTARGTARTTAKPPRPRRPEASPTGPADAQRDAGTVPRERPRAAQADHADSATDGYAELFAEAERAAEREREQPALFDAQPTAADVAGRAATARRRRTRTPGDAGRRPTPGDTSRRARPTDEVQLEEHRRRLTVSRAARQAEIIAELRAELDARVAAAQTAAPRRGADPDDEDLYVGASRDDDVDARTDVAGQGLST